MRDLRVEIPDGLTAWGDRARTQQILTNLLSNALKYSPPETPIEVTAQLIPAPTARQRLGQTARRASARPGGDRRARLRPGHPTRPAFPAL